MSEMVSTSVLPPLHRVSNGVSCLCVSVVLRDFFGLRVPLFLGQFPLFVLGLVSCWRGVGLSSWAASFSQVWV